MKIKMAESDFIELVTNLSDKENMCCVIDSENIECGEVGCANCWTKMLSEYIEI